MWVGEGSLGNRRGVCVLKRGDQQRPPFCLLCSVLPAVVTLLLCGQLLAVETGSEAAGRSASGRGLYLAALLHPTWAHQICMLSGKIQLLLILISGLSVS